MTLSSRKLTGRKRVERSALPVPATIDHYTQGGTIVKSYFLSNPNPNLLWLARKGQTQRKSLKYLGEPYEPD